MLKQHTKIFGFLMFSLDLCITAVSFVIGFFLRAHYLNIYLGDTPSLGQHLWVLLIIFPLWFFMFTQQKLYESQRLNTIRGEVFRIIKAVTIGTLLLSAFSFILELNYLSRSLLFSFALINIIGLTLTRVSMRLFLRYLRKKDYNYRNFLIVGVDKEAEIILKLVEEFKYWGIRIVGFVTANPSNNGGNFKGYDMLGTIDDLPLILNTQCIDGVIVTLPFNYLKNLKKTLDICEEVGVTAYVASDFLCRRIAKVYLEKVSNLPFIFFATTPQVTILMMLKRLIDVVLSALLLVLLSPLFLTMSLLIKLTSKGPVFFRQTRVGLNGRRFTLLKFRTMVNNAEQLKRLLENKNEVDGPVFKIRNDPRLTKIGGILRKFSLDELPQLLNVFNGDMSLVGPRPPLIEEIEKYERWQRRRLSMKPGLTCLWQANGRNHIKFEDWMRLDLNYIDNWSISLDFKILLKTIFAVLSCKGAY